jgi:two-component system response regulator LytT
MKKRILIVEDEPIAAKRLEKMIASARPDYIISGVLDSVDSTVQWLKENQQPDLIFMDIQLGDGLSFEIFRKVNVLSPVIFTTAYDDYAIRAFKFNSVDYLLKPIEPEAMNAAIVKFETHFGGNEMYLTELAGHLLQNNPVYANRFLVAKGDKWIPILSQDIAWFVSEDKHVYIVTHSGNRFHISRTLEQLEEELNPELFFRSGRKFILSKQAIVNVESGFNGKLHVNVNPKPEDDVSVSRERASEFREWLAK